MELELFEVCRQRQYTGIPEYTIYHEHFGNINIKYAKTKNATHFSANEIHRTVYRDTTD